MDEDAIMRLATERDLQYKLARRPGQFVGRDTPFLHAVSPARATAKVAEAVRGCFRLGTHRTPHQDALYSIQQLVEIAAHALSPGINEPFTALTCIDWLGSSLRGVVRPNSPTPNATITQGICARSCPC